jgi:methylated-DNA-[protein]-cysteine S-methyltransferase
MNQARRELRDYLAGKSKAFTCPVDLSGATSFQRAVWGVTAQIPYGRVRSYQWIAAKLGSPRGARAVGNALGANPIPLVIPCHRIVAGDASLGGFSCGLEWKRRLLTLEGSLRRLGKK